MGARSEKQRNKRIKLVGGGFRWVRTPNGVKGGTMKAQRRLARKIKKLQKKKGR